jgi:TadE-like protein
MRIKSRRGNTILEVAILTPVIAMLLVGMTQIAQITWLYYTLRKTVYSIGSYLNTQQGVNFCDAGDPAIAAAIDFGITNSNVANLTAGMFAITAQSFDPTTQTVSLSAGCSAPDYIVVSIPQGYSVQMAIPFFSTIDIIPLKPQVVLPYGGT